MEKIILASNSPRRKDLFSLFDLPFKIIPADINEDVLSDESPKAYVARLARSKADVIASDHEGLIIAADTIVVDEDQLLGKPIDQAEAQQMLRQLRGRTHQVYTGIALLRTTTGQTFETISRTDVLMRDYTNEEIDAYIASGDPMDKAGAYAIQNSKFHPVEGFNGCYASVMGLPLCQLAEGLQQFGYEIPESLPDRCQEYLNYDCQALADLFPGS